MTFGSLVALLPLLVLAATIVVVMLVVAFHRCHVTTVVLTLAGLALAFAMLPVAATAASREVTALLILDDFALFYMGLIFVAGFAVAAMSYGYFARQGYVCGSACGDAGDLCEEFYILLLSATLGGAVLAAGSHFASFFLGLELLSVSLYAMIAYPQVRKSSIEAGVKYLILAAGSAAFLLFGLALIYTASGTMEFAKLALFSATPGAGSVILPAGLALIVVGIGFKLALVPFHLWAPDVYEGAPAPVTAFVATASKGAIFAVLLRFFAQVDLIRHPSLLLVFAIMAVASMFTGNLLALLQNNVKRILAYSSIAHLGYLLVAFLASGALARTAAAFYLSAYFITTLGAFGVIAALSGKERDADAVDDYRGLFWRNPGLAGVFTAMLLSLAGIPLTAGFVGKFYVLAAGEQSARWVAVGCLVVNSAIGLFYYLRIVISMFATPEEGESAQPGAASLRWSEAALLACLTAALVLIGVFPSPFIRLIEMLATKPL